MQARKQKSIFRQSVAITAEIAATPEKIWRLLTDAADFPRWNSTVTSIDGKIALGEKLALRVPASPRTFTPKVSAFDAPRRMVWSDGAAPMFKGERVYEVAQSPGGARFSMTETFSGLMLPMIAPSLPDFGPIFERYAQDLKNAAET